MSFLLNLINRKFSSSSKQVVYKVLKQLRIDSNQPLPQNYHEILFSETTKLFTKQEILTHIIAYLSDAVNQSSIVKIYTILMCIVRMSDYDEQCCEALQRLQQISSLKSGQTKPIHLIELQKSCKSYLIKLYSMSELYRLALNKSSQHQMNEHINLYRLMNQYSLLFPYLNNTLNTIGRYYKQTSLFYSEFYRVWRSQIILGYNTIKKIIDNILYNYNKKDILILQCFIISIPQIQLLCDQMQFLITNKYFKGKSPNKKVYFKQELIQEIQYYIIILKNSNKQKDIQDYIQTADDDFFSSINKS